MFSANCTFQSELIVSLNGLLFSYANQSKREKSPNLRKFFSNFYGVPGKKSGRDSAFIAQDYRKLCKSQVIKFLSSPPRLRTGTGWVKRAIGISKNLNLANLEDTINYLERITRALKMMRFTIHSGLKVTLFKLHDVRKTENHAD